MTDAHEGAGAAGQRRWQVEFDAEGRVANALPCRGCGYLLKGLDRAGICPECSTPVERSIRGDQLRFCDPKWLAGLAAGLIWILAGGLAGVLAMIGAWVVVGVLMSGGGGPGTGMLVGMSFMGGVFALVVLVGVWLVTRPDPGGGTEARPEATRLVARWGIAVQLVYTPLEMYANPAGIGFSQATAALNTVQGVVTALSLLLAVVVSIGYLAFMLYLGHLAGRLPNRSLATQARIIGVGNLACQLIGTSMSIVLWALPATIGSVPSSVFIAMGFVGLVTAIAMLVLGIWAIVLLLRLMVEFRRAAAQALALDWS